VFGFKWFMSDVCMWVAGYAKVPRYTFHIRAFWSPLLAGFMELQSHRQRLQTYSQPRDSNGSRYTASFLQTPIYQKVSSELWNEVATLLRVPRGSASSDRFDKELAPGGVWLATGRDAAEVIWRLNIGQKAPELNRLLRKFQTLRDYIELFCKSDSKRV